MRPHLTDQKEPANTRPITGYADEFSARTGRMRRVPVYGPFPRPLDLTRPEIHALTDLSCDAIAESIAPNFPPISIDDLTDAADAVAHEILISRRLPENPSDLVAAIIRDMADGSTLDGRALDTARVKVVQAYGPERSTFVPPTFTIEEG